MENILQNKAIDFTHWPVVKSVQKREVTVYFAHEGTCYW